VVVGGDGLGLMRSWGREVVGAVGEGRGLVVVRGVGEGGCAVLLAYRGYRGVIEVILELFWMEGEELVGISFDG
jgi:hypothetical protein